MPYMQHLSIWQGTNDLHIDSFVTTLGVYINDNLYEIINYGLVQKLIANHIFDIVSKFI